MSDNRIKHTAEEVMRRAEKYSYENLPSEYQEKITYFSEIIGSGKILDIGCGHGRDVNFFTQNGFQTVGIDPSRNMIKFAENNMEGEYIQTSFEKYRGEEATFDGIWCNTVMQFLPPEKYDHIMKKINELLKTGGILYITFRLHMPSEHDKRSYTRKSEETNRYRITAEEAGKLLEKTGFEIIEEEITETNDPIISFMCKKE